MERQFLRLNKFFSVFFRVIFLTLVYTVLSVDQHFEACEPKSCGTGPSISYPFWIHEVHEDYCGYPGFGITCREDKAILQTSNYDYIIRDIFYNNQSFWLIDSGSVDKSCSSPLQNFTTNRPFELGQNVANLVFFYNCTTLYPKENLIYPVLCDTNPSLHSFAILLSEGELDYSLYASLECNRVVGAPVDFDGELIPKAVEQRNYKLFLQNGFALRWTTTATSCNECLQSGGRCGFLEEGFVCFCTDQSHYKSCKGTNMRKKLAIGLSVGMGVVLAITLVFCCLWILKDNSVIFWKRKKKAHRVVEEILKNYGSLAPTRYHYSDIKKITHSFKHKIGQGGYGVVYKGKLLDGRLVAVKILDKLKDDGEEFINEVASISRTSHVNIVSLVGFCFDGSKRALIYEFMVNGSLEKFIYDPDSLEVKSQLGWEMLYRITVGTARGLEYLHRGCNTRILHFDIKPHNILLDHDFTPKISDFGLAKLCPNKESVISMLDARGTAGYIAPEVFSRNFGGVSHKSDVYSYGMMVLEIVGRRKNINVQVDHTSEIYFPRWIYKRLILDADLELYGVLSQDETEIAKKMILIALWCIQTNPTDRPSMRRVVEMLEGRNELLQFPPKPYLCSPTRSPVHSSNT